MRERIIQELRVAIEDLSGLELDGADPGSTFLELGLDSLVLTQLALELKRRFGVNLAFRQLTENLATMDQLASHLAALLPAGDPAPVNEAVNVVAPAQTPAAPPPALPALLAGGDEVTQLIAAQLQLMQQQLAILTGAPLAAVPQAVAPAPLPDPVPQEVAPQTYDVKKAFGAIARIHVQRGDALTPLQRARLEALTRRYTQKTRGSKAYTAEHRAGMADPRVVSGFRPDIKELVYPIVVNRSHGARLWDIDGNEYVDALNGFGSNFFGYSPSFVQEALQRQVAEGFEVGPQHVLAGEVSRLVRELTGAERVALCNTGSEAVMGCMRVARTISGRRLVVMFAGSYHGIFDEVIVRATRKRTMPAAPGIMPSTAENILVLDYGTPESLEIIRNRASELAAVLVEPVQSRRPDFRPREFLHEVRAITQASGTALVFDEVITGFRTGPGGAQAYYGIEADLASYGKVAGGGLSIGIIAGKRSWMDALDGGHWEFGDDSVPTVGPTYFAGTFVRHPLALAASKAALEHLREQGPELQRRVSGLTDTLVLALNGLFEEMGAPLEVKHFASLWKAFWKEEHPWGDLLFVNLRDRGLHILDGFPCFLTAAWTQAEVDFTVQAFREAIAEMQDAGFLPPRRQPEATQFDAGAPPAPGARLGRDPEGKPAWYVPSVTEPGKYVRHGAN